MYNKLNLDRFNSAKTYDIKYANTNHIDYNYVKELRIKLNMTQNVFSTVLGVTKKTVEKWEQGKKSVKGATAKLLLLLGENPELIKKLYTLNEM